MTDNDYPQSVVESTEVPEELPTKAAHPKPDRAPRGPAAEALDGISPYSTAQEVAQIFRVSTRTVDRWTAQGRIRSIRATPDGASRRLYPRPELQRFAASLEVEI